MAVAFVSTANATSAGTGTVVVTAPANIATGVYLLAFVSTDNSTTPTAPSGFALITSVTSAAPYEYAYGKFASASEPASYSWTVAGNAQVTMLVYSGVYSPMPTDGTSTSTATGATTANTGSLTNVNQGDIYVACYTDTAQVTFSTPTGMTARNSVSVANSTAYAFDVQLTSGGNTAIAAKSSTISASSNYSTVAVALQPVLPLVETLVDAFSTNDLSSTLYTGSYGVSYDSTNQRASVTGTGTGYSSLTSSNAAPYTLAGSAFFVQMTLDNTAASAVSNVQILPATSNGRGGTRMELIWQQGSPNTLIARELNGGYGTVGTSGTSTAFSPGQTIWVAFAEGAGATKLGLSALPTGTVGYYVATTWGSWTLLKSSSTPTWVTQVQQIMGGNNTTSGVSGHTTYYDNLNAQPVAASSTTGNLTFTGTGVVAGGTVGNGAMTFAGSGADVATVATQGQLTFAGAGTVGAASSTANGSVTFSGSGSLTVTASGGAGSLAFQGSGGAAGVTPGGSGVLSFAGSGNVGAAIAGTGAATYAGVGVGTAAIQGSGSLTLSGNAGGSGRASASGFLYYQGTGTVGAQRPATGSGAVTYVGGGAVTPTATGFGVLGFSGAGTLGVSAPNTNATLTFTGSGVIQVSPRNITVIATLGPRRWRIAQFTTSKNISSSN